MPLKDIVKRREYLREWNRKRRLKRGHTPRAKNPLEKFMRNVFKTDTCWIWTGERNRFGHGMFREGGRWSKHTTAHRWAYQHFNSVTLKHAEFCCHKCSTRECVNPDHIYVGDQKQNVHDAIIQGAHNSVAQSKKTHCPKGHEYTFENTKHMVHKKGRQCRQCARIWANERYHRIKKLRT